VTSVTGAITITGTGGLDSSNVTISQSSGVAIMTGGQVTSTGTGTTFTGIAAAPITITGTGGTGGDENRGVLIDTNALVTSVTGAIAITGIGGQGNHDNDGVHVGGGAQVASTGPAVVGSATITIKGTSASGFALWVLDTSQISGNGTPITLTGDSMAINGAITSPGGIITVQPLTPGTSIGLGFLDGTLDLFANDLKNFSAGTLVIGNSMAGLITVNDAVALSKTSTLELITGLGIHTTGTGALNVANLLTDSGGPVSLNGNNVGTVAALASGAGSFVFNDNNNGLTVGTVAGTPGISTEGDVTLNVTGMLTIGSGPLSTLESITTPGIVSLYADGVVENGTSAISAAGLLLEGNAPGTYTLDNGNQVTTLAGSFDGPLSYVSRPSS
jgi:hypothetical protein